MSIYLGVCSGIHRGAKIRLARTGCSIGRTLGCDVVLADPSIAERHCALAADEKGLHITALAENVVALGHALKVGETVSTLERKTALNIGKVSLLLVNSRIPKPASSRSVLAPPPVQAPRKRAKYARRALTVVGFCAAAVTSYKALQGGGAVLVPWVASPSLATQMQQTNGVDPVKPSIDRFQGTLQLSTLLSQQPEWRGVKLHHTGADAMELVGVVETREALDRLRREGIVQSLGVRTAGISVADDLQRNAQDFTRDSSLVAELKSDGKLRLQSHSGTPESAQRANDFALQMSRQIEVETRSTYVPKEVKKPRRIELPVRIASINVAVGFFETEDGAKYFPGSTLAKGYVVESIDSRRILFRAGGKQVDFPIE